MGANQSSNINNDPGGMPILSSLQGSKTITKVKTHVESPSTLSAMSTDEPRCQRVAGGSPIERARKRARQDSESIIDDVCDGKHSTQLLTAGNELAPFSYEVFISSALCLLPESDNLEEVWHNLIEGRDMVTEDDRR